MPACLVMPDPQLKKRAVTKPPRFLRPRFLQRQYEQACPGCSWGTLVWCVFLSIALLRLCLTFKSHRVFIASARIISAVAAASLVGVLARLLLSVSKPPGRGS